jgi:hypothetical protein
VFFSALPCNRIAKLIMMVDVPSMLNWVGNNQHGYLLCSMILYDNFNCKTTYVNWNM